MNPQKKMHVEAVLESAERALLESGISLELARGFGVDVWNEKYLTWTYPKPLAKAETGHYFRIDTHGENNPTAKQNALLELCAVSRALLSIWDDLTWTHVLLAEELGRLDELCFGADQAEHKRQSIKHAAQLRFRYSSLIEEFARRRMSHTKERNINLTAREVVEKIQSEVELKVTSALEELDSQAKLEDRNVNDWPGYKELAKLRDKNQLNKRLIRWFNNPPK